jgi:hypothetical protein
MRTDHITEIGSARFVGLGCGAKISRKSVELSAYLQDADSGSMVTVSREFPNPPEQSKDPAKDFWQLAQAPALIGASFAASPKTRV